MKQTWQEGEKQESRSTWTVQRPVLPDAGLTGLLNPTSIWQKKNSVAFPNVLPSSFVWTVWSRLGLQMPCLRLTNCRRR
jgi:hypothetical protein